MLKDGILFDNVICYSISFYIQKTPADQMLLPQQLQNAQTRAGNGPGIFLET